MSKTKNLIDICVNEAGGQMYNVIVTKGTKKEVVNKNPLSKKDAEDLMAEYEKSGIKYDSLDMEIAR